MFEERWGDTATTAEERKASRSVDRWVLTRCDGCDGGGLAGARVTATEIFRLRRRGIGDGGFRLGG